MTTTPPSKGWLAYRGRCGNFWTNAGWTWKPWEILGAIFFSKTTPSPHSPYQGDVHDYYDFPIETGGFGNLSDWNYTISWIDP